MDQLRRHHLTGVNGSYEMDLTEGWEPFIHQTMIAGQLFDVLGGARATNSSMPAAPTIVDESYIWVPRVA